MATTSEIILGVALVLVALYYYFTARFNFWKSRGIKGPEPTPLVGNFFRVMFSMDSLGDFAVKLYNKYRDEPFVGVFERRTPILVVHDPEYIKDVLIKDFHTFANRGTIKNEIAEPLSQNLFNIEVERWRPLRSKLTPVFSSGKLKGTFSLILNCANNLDKYLDTLVARGEPIDVREVAARYSTDVIGSCAFGIEMNSLSEKESEFRRIGKEIFATHWVAILKIRMRESISGLYNYLGYILPYDEVTKFITKITIETMEYRKNNNIVRPDFINVLMELREQPEKLGSIKLTDYLLAAQAFVFFAAGYETSSTTIGNALYELALNQEIQKKLRAEIKEYDAKNNGEWTYEIVKQMPYLDKVFKETLRKYPPLAILMRETTEPYTFRRLQLSLPKGTKVWIPVYAIHMDSNIYSKPKEFDPNRFTDEAEKARHPMHYMPFGDGPRNCIGARFGIYQVKIGLIKILLKRRVEVCEKTPIPLEIDKNSFVTVPKAGVPLKVVRDEN